MTQAPLTLGRTPLYQWHVQQGAQFTDRDGWRLPALFTNVEQEVARARSHVGLVDVSALAKVRLTGPPVRELAREFTGNGCAVIRGRVFAMDLDEAMLGCMLTDDQLLVLAAATNAVRLQQYLAERGGDRATERHDVTYALAGIHVIGPNSESLLRRLTHFDVSPRVFPSGSCAETACAGIHATLVRDPDWPQTAVRVYVAWDFGEYLWQKLFDAGRNLGVVPVGMEAWGRMTRGE
jgi:heterotetrameric sarcosine oxidase gamma subunit